MPPRDLPEPPPDGSSSRPDGGRARRKTRSTQPPEGAHPKPVEAASVPPIDDVAGQAPAPPRSRRTGRSSPAAQAPEPPIAETPPAPPRSRARAASSAAASPAPSPAPAAAAALEGSRASERSAPIEPEEFLGAEPSKRRRASRASRSTASAARELAPSDVASLDRGLELGARGAGDDDLPLPRVEATPFDAASVLDAPRGYSGREGRGRAGSGHATHAPAQQAHPAGGRSAERRGQPGEGSEYDRSTVRHASVRRAVPLDEERIDPDVQKVVRRLVRAGYEAYLVGGCVRDLLLERTPKDFDVATSARPEQVRELFRNSRVIGRRFRLVHVLFQGGKVIEVATFRRKPHEEDASSPAHDDDPLAEASNLLIRSDNVFGEADEDARRRDFTINGLFYDLESQEILDWVGGLDDVRDRVVDTIGDPVVRFREDPVRILRALKFAGRLDLGIRPATYDAMVHCRDALELAARPRLAEEVLRLLRGGEARRTLFLAWESGILAVLLPELSALLDDNFSEPAHSAARPGRISARSAGDRVFRLMEYVDQRSDDGAPLDDTALWTLLLLEPIKEAVEGARDRATAVGEFLDPLIERLAIPRRFADGIRRVIAVLPRILAGKAGRFARTELFSLAVDVAEAEVHARGLPSETLRSLRASLGAEPRQPEARRSEPRQPESRQSERGAPQRGARAAGRPRHALPRP